ncbi:hypothetical protein B0H15DRAFT_485277 [Mycena belliarum]|uniref:Uncharacterized protein n=1 Tax=Mycena belliarum TaxID=1033014 RepID=A0AAD6TWY4_9AGAR|nr:hypothetical protein B0H15DRAFT_485277 [Mycena belliae]
MRNHILLLLCPRPPELPRPFKLQASSFKAGVREFTTNPAAWTATSPRYSNAPLRCASLARCGRRAQRSARGPAGTSSHLRTQLLAVRRRDARNEQCLGDAVCGAAATLPPSNRRRVPHTRASPPAAESGHPARACFSQQILPSASQAALAASARDPWRTLRHRRPGLLSRHAQHKRARNSSAAQRPIRGRARRGQPRVALRIRAPSLAASAKSLTWNDLLPQSAALAIPASSAVLRSAPCSSLAPARLFRRRRAPMPPPPTTIRATRAQYDCEQRRHTSLPPPPPRTHRVCPAHGACDPPRRRRASPSNFPTARGMRGDSGGDNDL